MKPGKAVQGIILFFCIWAVVMLPIPGFGSVPQQINYQGALSDDLGNPLEGDHVMVFSIYNVSSGGTPLWWEQQTVTVTNGICSVQIGQNPAGNPFPPDLFDNSRWLGITVGADAEMSPRQLLSSVPFAFKAEDADTLDGLFPDDFADAGHDHGFTDITGMVTDAQVPDNITILNAEHANHAEVATNAELLDGRDAGSFAPVEHGHVFDQISGQAGDAQIPDNITINYAAQAGFATQAGNAESLDGLNVSAFMPAGTDNWVNEGGDTMSGRLEVETNLIGTGWGESIKGILNTSDVGAGVYGWSGGNRSYGVAGGATGSSGRGVYGEVTGDNGIGVYGDAFNTSAGIGVYGRGAAWAGYFDGNLYADGNVGIGTTNPTESRLHVAGDLKVAGDDGWSFNGDEAVIGLGSVLGHFFIKAVYGDGLRLGAYAVNDAFVLKQISGNVGIGTADPVSRLDVNGTTTTKVLAITGGADIAEPFDVKPDMAVKPGMILSIDAENPGKLKLSEKAYDRCVAGIISSAGGIQPGMIMSQTGSVAEGEHPIALSGRVYCWADAGGNPIVPGDLLTTSDTPGHAMKAMDMERSQGAVLGKAMTALKGGTGLVLVLVSLQ